MRVPPHLCGGKTGPHPDNRVYFPVFSISLYHVAYCTGSLYTGVVPLRTVKPEELHGGLRSTGSHPLHVAVQAFCQCGWVGRHHPWDDQARAAEEAELDAHLAATGHTAFPSDTDGLHSFGCGHFHELNDVCPYPLDSPAGRLRRITTGSTLDHPDRALDRLSAIEALRAWLDEQEQEAAIGARLSGCTWADMGVAIGATRQAAWNRWGQMIGRYEQAGVIRPVEETQEGQRSPSTGSRGG
jgi:hypothetical protein